jgi:lipid-binding SYLF domain-containing protein
MVICLAMGCNAEPTPRSEMKKDALDSDVQAQITRLNAQVPDFKQQLNNAYGYVIFPSVGKGGLIVGGAYGRGQVYEQGRLIGYADITQLTLGLQAGGEGFTEVILFQNKDALDRFTNNRWEPAASASAVALKAGASAAVRYTEGVAVLTYAESGLMGELSVGGQRFRFTGLGNDQADRNDNMNNTMNNNRTMNDDRNSSGASVNGSIDTRTNSNGASVSGSVDTRTNTSTNNP